MKLVEEDEPKRPVKRDYGFCIACFVLAVVFFGLAVLLFMNAQTKLDSKVSQELGITYAVNIQGTIYAAGCGIISAIFAVGGMILAHMAGRD